MPSNLGVNNNHDNIHEDSLKIEDIMEISKRLYLYYLLKFYGFLFSSVLTIIVTFYQFSFMYSIIPIFFFNFFNFSILIYFQCNSSKALFSFLILEIFFDLIYLILFTICILKSFDLVFSLSSGLVHVIVNFISCKDHGNTLFIPHIFVINTGFYLTVLFVILKYESFISWSFYISFWPLYVIFIVCLIFSFRKLRNLYVSTAQLFHKFINLKTYIIENFEIFTIILSLSAITPSILYLSMTNLDLSNINTYKTINRISFGIFAYCGLEMILMTISKQKIKNYIKEYFIMNYVTANEINRRSQTEVERLQTEYNQRNENESHHTPIFSKPDISEMKKLISIYVKHTFPKHLIMKNSCYFTFEENENQIKIKQKKRGASLALKSNFDMLELNNQIGLNKESKNLEKIVKTHIKSLSLCENGLNIENEAHLKCLMCCDKIANSVIMECGHGGMCYDCCLKIWKTGEECHICRNKISEVIQISPIFNEKIEIPKFLITSVTFLLNQENFDKLKSECLKFSKFNKSADKNVTENDINILVVDFNS